MTKILVLSRGKIGAGMASPGIRSYHMARVLAEQLPDAEVTLAAPNEPDIASPHPRLRVVQFRSQWAALRLALGHDVIISRNFPPHFLPLLSRKRLVLDSFTTLFIEWMELSKRRPDLASRKRWMTANQHYLNLQFTLADYIICSNERQRDLWIGALGALGLITADTYRKDSTLRNFVEVLPYGVQPGAPQHTKQVLKGIVPGIKETDTVLIWNGLLVEWFDAPTLIRAMAEVRRTRDDVKLFFLGTQHPEWITGKAAPPVQEVIALSKQLDLYESSVFFNFGWVPYQDIGNYLTEADIGVCTSFNNLEARYSFRTRFVDLIWADLPIVCTQGDVLAEQIERDTLGISVPAGDSSAIASAILKLVEDREFYAHCQRQIASVREEMRWERTLEPLVEFCRSGEGTSAKSAQRLFPLLQHAALYGVSKMLTPMTRD